MRRSVAFVLGTVSGTALLVGAKLGTHSPAAASTSVTATALGGGAVVTGGSTPRSPAASRTPTPSVAGTPTSRSTTGSHSTAKPGPTATPKPTATRPPTPSGPKDGSYNASAPVDGGHYGTLSMTVTISGNKITNIAASEANPTESSCYHSACPTLKSEALSAQSASISSVSGATYTSGAYKSALQAVLSSAKG